VRPLYLSKNRKASPAVLFLSENLPPKFSSGCIFSFLWLYLQRKEKVFPDFFVSLQQICKQLAPKKKGYK